MTGFITRLLTRGTGHNLQSNQVMFQPRPRSRFESGLTALSMENDNTPETSGPIKAAPLNPGIPSRPPESRPPEPDFHSNKSESPLANEKNISTDEENKNSEISSSRKIISKSKERTGPASSNPTTVKTSNKDSDKTSLSPEKISRPADVSSNQQKPDLEKQDSISNEPQSHLEREPNNKPILEHIPHRDQKRGNPVKELFKVIEDHNSKVVGQEKLKNDFPFGEAGEIQEIEKRGNNEIQVSEIKNPNEAQSPALTKDSQEFGGQQRNIDSTSVTISIGQIQVEFIQPETGIMQQPQPAIQRTRGFEGYSRARRGNPRR